MGSCESVLPPYNVECDFQWKINRAHQPTRSKIMRNSECSVKHAQQWKSARDIFLIGMSISADKPCIGQRERLPGDELGQFKWLTYREVNTAAFQLGTSLTRLNLCPEQVYEDELYENAKRLRQLGIFAKNCPEWLIVEQTGNLFGYTLVPLYESFDDDNLLFIINQTRMECLFVSVVCLRTLNRILPQAKTLKFVILLDVNPWITSGLPVESHHPERVAYQESFSYLLSSYSVAEVPLMPNRACSSSVEMFLWSDLISHGKTETICAAVDVGPANVHTLCYTSGTTGRPKAAVITHKNITGSMRGALESIFNTSFALYSTDTHISYLPLPHIYERIMCQVIYLAGGSIGVYSGDVAKLFEDVAILRPTIFAGVPRVYTKLLDTVISGVAKKAPLVQQLFFYGTQAKLYHLRMSGALRHLVWDTLIFNKLCRQVFGDRLRFFVSSAAPLSTYCEEFMQVLFSCEVIQAYGLTESTGPVTARLPGDRILGHVGGVLTCTEMCLESVPELNANALAVPPKGEILLRGVNIVEGYFREPELTKASFDEDGWYHTGDVGTFLTQKENHGLRIVDRKKNIFKLSQGEYVTPEKVESTYATCSLISQIFVHGESDKSFLVAIIVPDMEVAFMWAENNKVESNINVIIEDPRFLEALRKQMVEAEKNLKGYEKVKSFKVISDPFSIENDLLTPTVKLKRANSKNKFFHLLSEMYGSSGRDIY